MAVLSALIVSLFGLGLSAGSGAVEQSSPARADGVSGVVAARSVEGLTPRQKAALLVVSGLPNPPRGAAGVILSLNTVDEHRPKGALVFVDQEGGEVRRFVDLPPRRSASAYRRVPDAERAGRATGRALDRKGVHVDFAPVLDAAGGPLGERHFARPGLGLAFSRGLSQGGTAPCVKHFPGLGTAPISTDLSTGVRARITRGELRAFRRAVADGVPCVMMSHAFYKRFGARRASFSGKAYRFLRKQGFDGVAITDSVSVFGSRNAVTAAKLAARAGADLILYTNGPDARRAVRALVPLARSGALDDQVERVLRLRREWR